MDIEQLNREFQAAIEAGDFNRARSFLADDFQFSGAVPKPLNGEQWIGLLRVMRAAFPDLTYNFVTDSVDGDVVYGSNRMMGTHSGDFDLSWMGMGVIKPTGRVFYSPQQDIEATWDGDSVVSLHVNPVDGGGLMGILHQLGIQPSIRA